MPKQIISLEQPEDWRRALVDVPHSYWQTWDACAAFANGHGLKAYLFSIADSEVRAVCSFAERSRQGAKDIFTPIGFGGFSGRGSSVRLREKWSAFVKDRGYVCGYFALHPEVGWHEAHEGLSHANDLYVLDLKPGLSIVRDSVDRSVGRALRDWDRQDRSYVTDRDVLTRFILDNYRDFMARKQASPRTIWPQETLTAMCADPKVLMVGIEDEHGICAAHSFAHSDFGAECHVSVWVREGRQLTTSLLWWGIEQVSFRGLPWLQMGGGLRPGDSIAKAKEKFRARAKPFLVAKEIYLPEKYESLCIDAGVDPHVTEGFFPAYYADR